jgi:hypothetical protein
MSICLLLIIQSRIFSTVPYAELVGSLKKFLEKIGKSLEIVGISLKIFGKSKAAIDN